MDKFKPFEVKDIVTVIGKEGTNGPLILGELYEVFELTDENNQESADKFFYALQPVVILDEMGKKYKPYLGKLTRH